MMHYTPNAGSRQPTSIKPMALVLSIFVLIMFALYILPQITQASPSPSDYKATQEG